MGKRGGRGRNTAKTGDKALYKSRNPSNDSHHTKQGVRSGDGDDDPMYNDVDRFHRNRQKEEFLRIDQDVGGSDSSDDDDQEEAVMDLGLGGSDDDDESVGDESSVASSENDGAQPRDAQQLTKGDSSSSDDDDDDDESNDDDELQDVRDWGKRKSSYYHGDTADLEIGQDQEDAFLEEQAAKEVQAARYKDLTEDDFALDDLEEEVAAMNQKKKRKKVGDAIAIERNVQNLSRREKRKILDKEHPEFLPLLSHFTDVVNDLKDRTMVATTALLEGEEGAAEAVGATPLGQRYLVTKAMIQTSSALNLAAYLLLKAQHPKEEMASHPVMARLQRCHKLAQQLESSVEGKVPGLDEQLDKLVKAAHLVDAESETEDERSIEENADQSSSKENFEAEEDHGATDDSRSNQVEPKSTSTPLVADEALVASSSDEDQDNEPTETEDQRRRQVLIEARFGLRPSELEEVKTTGRKRRAAPDFGEDTPDDGTTKAKAFASTLNSIQQRSTTKQKQRDLIAEDVDDYFDQQDDYGHDESELHEVNARAGSGVKSNHDGEDDDPELDDDLEGGDFYSRVARKSQSRKAARKSLHQVAPKFPRVEFEVDGERAVTKAILKNRGLVAHKNRLNRNPRVKKREQYRKALIRRKGAVREVRTDEGHKYGGEGTGIKSGLSRSRKL